MLIATALLSTSALQCGSLPATAVAAASSGSIGVSPVVARAPQSAIVMAVPKKRQSKMKTRQRKANWYAKARRQATLALSRAKSVNYDPLEDPKYSFDDVDDDDDDEDEEDDE